MNVSFFNPHCGAEPLGIVFYPTPTWVRKSLSVCAPAAEFQNVAHDNDQA